MKLMDVLRGLPRANGEWQFELGQELHGAFGGANGGVLAATCLAVARTLAPDRVPTAIDAHFLRGLTAGTARVVPSLIHAGRTLSCVSADLFDERGKLCTRATVTLVQRDALHEVDSIGDTGPPAARVPYAQGKAWARPTGPVRVPLIETFGPRLVGRDRAGIATAVRVLWDERGTTAEAACIAADISVGPPVMEALGGRAVPMPNPDLSLRFCADPALPDAIVASARLERIDAGLATTRIEVRVADELTAVGVSTTTLLAGAWPDAMRSAGKLTKSEP